MRKVFAISLYFLLLAFGVFLVVRGYQHVMLVPSLIGLFLVVALVLFAVFRLTVYRALQAPRTQAVLEFCRCVGRGIRPMSLLYSLPLFAAGLFFLLIFLNLRHAVPWAVSLGTTMRHWYLSEGLALLIAPFLVWIFAPDETTPAWQRTPLWQRIIALPVVLLFIGGFGFFIRILQVAWAFVLFRSVLLYFQRPDDEEQAIGCLQVIFDIVLLFLLGVILVNRRDYAYGSLESLHRDLRPIGASMLFGCAYFFSLGVIEILFRPLLYTASYYRMDKRPARTIPPTS